MAKKQANDNITVQFQQNYVAERGAGIAGAKGDVRTYPATEQVRELLDKGVVKAVKSGAAAEREKATTDE